MTPALPGYQGDVTPRPDDDPSPEDPNRFRPRPEVAPLDEPPDGLTPSDPNEEAPDSLPPGASAS
jgi:hypothetical protein